MSEAKKISFRHTPEFLDERQKALNAKKARLEDLRNREDTQLHQKVYDAGKHVVGTADIIAKGCAKSFQTAVTAPFQLAGVAHGTVDRLVKKNTKWAYRNAVKHNKQIAEADELVRYYADIAKVFKDKLASVENAEGLDISIGDIMKKEAIGLKGLLETNLFDDDVKELLKNAPDLTGQPVYLIRGILAPAWTMIPVKQYLEAKGAIVKIEDASAEGWNLPLNTGNSRDKTEQMARDITELHEETGKPVTIIGWSHGGMSSLIAANEVPEKVGRIITLAGVVNSNHPTVPAKMIYLNCNFEQAIKRQSITQEDTQALLAMMKDFPANNPHIDMICIGTDYDGLVKYDAATRPEDAHLPNVTNIKVNTGHISIPFSDEVQAIAVYGTAGWGVSKKPGGKLEVAKPQPDAPSTALTL